MIFAGWGIHVGNSETVRSVERGENLSPPLLAHALCGIVTSLLLAVTSVAQVQSTDIRGIVYDSSNGNRLQFVNIVLLGTTIGTTTNSDGFFLLPKIPPGEHELQASYVGYERVVRTVNIVADQSVSLSIALAPTSIDLQEVPVTARGGAELLKSSSSKHIIDRQTMERVPQGGQPDILQSLKFLPGIVSTSDISSKFHVRGGASDQNLFYLDDIKIYNPYHALGIFSIFDPTLIRSTEIFTGAFPAGYGGRLSSVLRLNSRDGHATRPSASVGVNSLSSNVVIDLPLSLRLRSVVGGRRSIFPGTWKRFLTGNPQINFYDAAAKVTFDDPETQTKAHGMIFGTEDDLSSRAPELPSYKWRNVGGGVSVSGLLDRRVFIKSTASYTSYGAFLESAPGAEPQSGSTSINEFAVRSELTVYLDTDEFLIGGFDFGFPSVQSTFTNSSRTVRTVSDTYPSISSWMRYQSSVDQLSLDVGLHAEMGLLFTQNEGWRALQPRINIGWEAFPGFHLKGGYGRVSQNMLTINNEDDLISLFDYWILIPEEIGPQRADHYVSAIDWQISSAVAFTIETYLKDFHTLVVFNKEKVDAVDPDYVRGSGSSYGMEALVRLRQYEIDFYLSYGLGRSEVRSGLETHAPRHDRRHALKVLATTDLTRGLTATVRWEFGSGFPFTPASSSYYRYFVNDLTPESYLSGLGESYLRLGSRNSKRLPSFYRLDLSCEYTFALWKTTGRIGVHILNLFDRRNLFYYDRASGRRVDMLRFFPSVTGTLSF